MSMLAVSIPRASIESLNVSGLVAELKKCSRSGNLQRGRKAHKEALNAGLFSNLFVANTLINMYGRCGSTGEALQVFNSMEKRDTVSWNCLLQGCVANGKDELALELFETMYSLRDGCDPDGRTYASALAACTSLATDEHSKASRKWLAKAESIHSQALGGLCCDLFVENMLIILYSKCGLMSKAQDVFDGMLTQDVASWNALLQGYVENGDNLTALKLYERMEKETCCFPDARTYVTVLSACGALATGKDDSVNRRWLEKAKEIHARALSTRCVYVETKLIEIYSTCGCLKEARRVFNEMPHRNTVAWNCIIQGHVESGESEQALELFEEMKGCTPNERTFVAALTACASLGARKDGKSLKWLTAGRSLHSRALISRSCNRFVNNILITMYGSCGSTEDAKKTFDRMPERGLVSCTALMKAYVENEQSDLALKLFETVERERSLVPDAKFYVAALTACSALAERELPGHETRQRWLLQGKSIHSRATEHSCCDLYVGNSLIDLYSKCGSMEDARHVFNTMVQRDVVSWTVLLQGYVHNQENKLALELFESMEEHAPDSRTYAAALTACTNLCSKSSELESVDVPWLEVGRRIFSKARIRNLCNVYVWNSWIRCCMQSGENLLALEQIYEMQSVGVLRT